jgi:hypothetical protein
MVTALHWTTLSTRRRHAGENDFRHVWIRDYAEDTIGMSNRARDWFEQALKDLEAAEHLRRVGRYEWACFTAHQASEKAVKSLKRLKSTPPHRRGRAPLVPSDQTSAPLDISVPTHEETGE